MSILSRINKVGLVPMWYKFKALYLNPSGHIITTSSQDGAYQYLKRYRSAARLDRTVEPQTTVGETQYVWVCWLQGLDDAPQLVKQCVKSIVEHNPGKEVVVLTDKNIEDYVTVPAYIKERRQSGCMSRTHYSDVVRLLLLNQYGGIWMDSTILMTGAMPDYILESPFFVYHTVSEAGHVCCANGFMAACPHHPIIEDTLNLLLAYWQKETRLVSYSIMHLFLYMCAYEVSEADSTYWKEVPLYYFAECEKLRHMLGEPFDEKSWARIQQASTLHKLSYKFWDFGIDTEARGTFYDVLISGR